MAMNEQLAKTGSYLIGQGEKLSIVEIAEKIEIAFGEMSQAVARNFTPAQPNFQPTPEDWSIVEVLTHITNFNIGTCETVAALASGKEVTHGPRNLLVTAEDDLAAAVNSNKFYVLNTVRELPQNPDLETTIDSAFGRLNFKSWLLFIRVHTLNHANQIKNNQAHSEFPINTGQR